MTVPYFNGRTSFISYPPLTNSFSRTFLYLEIRPASPDGLLLLNTQLCGPDFIAVAIRAGRVELWFDLGQGAIRIASTVSLTLDDWHSIQVTRSGRDGELVVDDAPPVVGWSPHTFTLLQISSDLYLGSAPLLPPSLPLELRLLGGFRGCVRTLRVTPFVASALDLIADARLIQDVQDCPVVEACNSSTCLNGGSCSNTVEGFVCACEAGFVGARCEVDLCVIQSPCRNNGVCYGVRDTGGVDRLLCNCSAPFSGTNCTESEFFYKPASL